MVLGKETEHLSKATLDIYMVPISTIPSCFTWFLLLDCSKESKAQSHIPNETSKVPFIF